MSIPPSGLAAPAAIGPPAGAVPSSWALDRSGARRPAPAPASPGAVGPVGAVGSADSGVAPGALSAVSAMLLSLAGTGPRRRAHPTLRPARLRPPPGSARPAPVPGCAWTAPSVPEAAPARRLSSSSAPLRCRTQGRELDNTTPHTRARSSPCVRCVFLKSGSLCAYSEGVVRDPEQSSWGLALVRVFPWAAGVVGRVRSALGLSEGAPPGQRALSAVSAARLALARAPPFGVDARCRPGCEFEGALSIRTRVVGTVRGSLTS